MFAKYHQSWTRVIEKQKKQTNLKSDEQNYKIKKKSLNSLFLSMSK
jgi:hypothetical protein